MRGIKTAFRLGLLVMLAMGLAGLWQVPGLAQTAGGTVQGTVTDPSGAVIPGATVSVKNQATGVVRPLTTNSAGFYSAPNLTPGVYGITASAKGFKTEVQHITLTVGAEDSINFALSVGAATQTIQVTGAATQVNLVSSTVQQVVGGKTIVGLPLNGRDWTQLAQLQPGVTKVYSQYTTFTNGAQRGNGVNISISGGRPAGNNYLMNGVSINDYANSAPGSSLGVNLGVDAIEEFSVVTGTPEAQYGRTTAGVINAVTKSGTNQFHGDAYAFIRNSDLDARNFFDSTRPAYRRQQFGGSLGGPIQKDKTFFFTDYEGVRSFQGITTVSFVPSPAARAGQLSTGTVTVNPEIAQLLGAYPL
ncbi:MAG: carboxypeptidase regulatory-like domain-containing protein, partial [bacterium]